MARHGISFTEATRQLFNSELVSLNASKESYYTFLEMGNLLDCTLVHDYVNRLGLANHVLKQGIQMDKEDSLQNNAGEGLDAGGEGLDNAGEGSNNAKKNQVPKRHARASEPRHLGKRKAKKY